MNLQSKAPSCNCNDKKTYCSYLTGHSGAVTFRFVYTVSESAAENGVNIIVNFQNNFIILYQSLC